MGWEHLAEMRDAGVDIQGHTVTHSDLRRPYDKVAKKKLSPDEYEAWLQNEVAGSKQMIEQKLGVKVNCLAVPYGFHNDHVREVTIKAGYEALFTVYGQPISMHTPLNSVGRYLMEANKPKTFTDALAAIATTASGPTTQAVSSSNLQTQPAAGETIKNPLPLIKANICLPRPDRSGHGAGDAGERPWESGCQLRSEKFDGGLSGDATTQRQGGHRHRQREIRRKEGGNELEL